MGIVSKIRRAMERLRPDTKTGDIDEISKLVADLNGTDEPRAKSAARQLDLLLYPDFSQRSNGPTVLMAPEALAISHRHYDRVRASESIRPLVTTLSSGSEFGKAYACVVLGAIKAPGVLPLLLTALGDQSASVRIAATKGLRFLRDPSTVPVLIEKLRDPDREVRHSVARTLGWIGSIEALDPLTELYHSEDKGSRVVALYALGDIGNRRSLPLARAALSSRYRELRNAAKSVLGKYDMERRKAAQPGATDNPGDAQ